MTRFDYELLRERSERMRRRADQYRLARTAEGDHAPDLRRDLSSVLLRLGAWLEAEPEQTDRGAELYRQQAS